MRLLVLALGSMLSFGSYGQSTPTYPTKTVPTGNLLLSVLDKFDIHQESIGDSTGRLEAL